MKLKIILLFSIFLFSTVTFAQSKKVWLATADEYFANSDFISALKYYKLTLDDTVVKSSLLIPYDASISNQKLTKKNRAKGNENISLEDYVNHQMALCYEKTFDYSHALSQFQLSNKNNAYPQDLYHIGLAQMKLTQYEEAKKTFQAYIDSPTKTDSIARLASKGRTGCDFALNPKNFKKKTQVMKSDSVTFNTGTSNFAASYFGGQDRLIFSSARLGGVILDPEKQQSEFLCDLYWVEKIDSTKWATPHNFGRPLNSAQHDASGIMSKNNVMYFSKWNDEKKEDQTIYLARMQNFLFYESAKLDSNVNLPGFKSIHPNVTEDTKTLYFSSNRPGGFGGMDIWKIGLDDQGNPFGLPENLGIMVNSAFDEVTPFFHEASSSLFYSSNGFTSMGGLDVFKSTMNREERSYSSPINLGAPINSSKDDAYLIMDDFLQTGYFSSDREDCPAGHCFDIYEIKNEPIKIMLEGVVISEVTEQPIRNASVTFKDIRSEFATFIIKTDEKGYYSTPLELQSEVFVKAQMKGYFASSANIDTRSISSSITLTQDFVLKTIPGEEIEISGIEYDYNSDKLRPISMTILDKMYEFLELNNNLAIDINSHTDARGSDIYNKDLSQRRAKSVVDYLISKGISKDRLKAKGYGESSPTALTDENKTAVLDASGAKILLTEAYINSRSPKVFQEELHQRNRRTSFRVVVEAEF